MESDGMVVVPAGSFLYGNEMHKEIIEKPFLIDIYPVTNRQYEQFIKHGGYIKDEYWSENGRKWRDENMFRMPYYRKLKEWNQPEFPVVWVTYFEAEAYAKWAKKRLPKEKEWEKAARGVDGREYPWGDTFDTAKCNTAESGIGRTTPVARYPEGVSPYGCYDMAGNVWEWTDNQHEDDKDAKVLRGGSWDFDQVHARCAFRDGLHPLIRFSFIGFRCVKNV